MLIELNECVRDSNLSKINFPVLRVKPDQPTNLTQTKRLYMQGRRLDLQWILKPHTRNYYAALPTEGSSQLRAEISTLQVVPGNPTKRNPTKRDPTQSDANVEEASGRRSNRAMCAFKVERHSNSLQKVFPRRYQTDAARNIVLLVLAMSFLVR